jgi:hypothetical protein
MCQVGFKVKLTVLHFCEGTTKMVPVYRCSHNAVYINCMQWRSVNSEKFIDESQLQWHEREVSFTDGKDNAEEAVLGKWVFQIKR